MHPVKKRHPVNKMHTGQKRSNGDILTCIMDWMPWKGERSEGMGDDSNKQRS